MYSPLSKFPKIKQNSQIRVESLQNGLNKKGAIHDDEIKRILECKKEKLKKKKTKTTPLLQNEFHEFSVTQMTRCDILRHITVPTNTIPLP